VAQAFSAQALFEPGTETAEANDEDADYGRLQSTIIELTCDRNYYVGLQRPPEQWAVDVLVCFGDQGALAWYQVSGPCLLAKVSVSVPFGKRDFLAAQPEGLPRKSRSRRRCVGRLSRVLLTWEAGKCSFLPGVQQGLTCLSIVRSTPSQSLYSAHSAADEELETLYVENADRLCQRQRMPNTAAVLEAGRSKPLKSVSTGLP
jgi:hypothetical protein